MAVSPAAAVVAEPRLQPSLLFPSRQWSLASPHGRGITSLKPQSRSMVPSPCCSAGALDSQPAAGSTSSSYPVSDTGAIKEGGKDRRRAVRIAWEKLVRWSRSWRSKVKSDVLERTKKVVVLGGGSFGTAMAAHIASKKAEMEVNMLLRDDDVCRAINDTHCNCKYFPDYKLPENIVATTSPKLALQEADFCLHAVPVQFTFSRRHF